jgi:hypothetical protein
LGSLPLPAAAAAYLPRRLAGRDEIRAWGEKVPTFVDFLVQTTYPGIIALDGDLASGRAYMQELGRARDDRSALNYAVDTTATGGRATAGNSPSVYEVMYEDTSPLAGSARPADRRTAGRLGSRLQRKDDGYHDQARHHRRSTGPNRNSQ